MSRSRNRGRGEDSLSLFDLPLQGGDDGRSHVTSTSEADAVDADSFDAEAIEAEPSPAPEPAVTNPAVNSAATGSMAHTSSPPAPADVESVTTSGLFEQLAERHVDIDPIPAPQPPRIEELPADLTTRLRAGVADLATVCLAVLVGAGGAALLGVPLSASRWQPFAALACAFSFPYLVVPLAFWGQSPGMAWAGLTARATDGEPLTFQQTTLRWAGSLVTVLLAGLPLPLAHGLTGGSLSDWLSGSETVRLISVLAEGSPSDLS